MRLECGRGDGRESVRATTCPFDDPSCVTPTAVSEYLDDLLWSSFSGFQDGAVEAVRSGGGMGG
jgi:hypothetical protein